MKNLKVNKVNKIKTIAATTLVALTGVLSTHAQTTTTLKADSVENQIVNDIRNQTPNKNITLTNTFKAEACQQLKTYDHIYGGATRNNEKFSFANYDEDVSMSSDQNIVIAKGIERFISEDGSLTGNSHKISLMKHHDHVSICYGKSDYRFDNGIEAFGLSLIFSDDVQAPAAPAAPAPVQKPAPAQVSAPVQKPVQPVAQPVQKSAQPVVQPVQKVEAPKIEAPKVEAPKVETPKVEAPKVEAPKTEVKKAEAPKVEVKPETQTAREISASEAAKARAIATKKLSGVISSATSDDTTVRGASKSAKVTMSISALVVAVSSIVGFVFYKKRNRK